MEPLALIDHVAFLKLRDYGQLTLPKELRDKLKINTDSYLMVIIIPLVSEEASLTKEKGFNYLRQLFTAEQLLIAEKATS